MSNKKRGQEFAVIGLGRFGSGVALRLEELGYQVLGIDRDPAVVQRLSDQLAQAAALDATQEEALQAVDIQAFDTVIVAIGEDFEANMLATASLKSLGISQVICKANTARQRDLLLRIGADRVVQPEQSSGRRLAEELSIPAMLSRLPLGPGYSLAEVVLPEKLSWRSLRQSEIREKYQLTVIVVKRADELIVSPPADLILEPGDRLFVLGSDKAVNHFGTLA
jgi:trk system potassium uptake protein